MSHFRISRGLIVSVVLLGGLAAASWYYFSQRTEKAPEIDTIQVSKGDVTQVVTASGTIDPVTSVEVSSQISGLIREVLVDYNSLVKQGDVLARIDPATYDQRLKQAKADFASSQASNTLARLNTERTRELYAKNLVTQQDRDSAEAQLAQADAALLTRQAAVDDALVNLSRCTLYAPINGIVMQRAADVGKTVAASLNAPTLFIIANELAKMQITAAVAEADIGNIEAGQSVSFTVDAFPTRNFKGKVIQVRNYPKTASNVVTYETIIEVNNDGLKLKPGMTANVSIVVAERRDTLKIANSAIRVRVPPELLVQKAEPAKTGTAKATAPMTDEERRRIRMEVMREAGFTPGAGRPTPEIIAKAQELAKARGIELDFSRGPGGGGGRGGERAAASQVPTGTTTRTLYRLTSSDPLKPVIEAVTVKLGISDGMFTEVIEGLAENDALVTSVNQAGTRSTQTGGTSNPMMPFGGGRGGMGGGGGGRR
jgi:HlyD family secretion protein